MTSLQHVQTNFLPVKFLTTRHGASSVAISALSARTVALRRKAAPLSRCAVSAVGAEGVVLLEHDDLLLVRDVPLHQPLASHHARAFVSTAPRMLSAFSSSASVCTAPQGQICPEAVHTNCNRRTTCGRKCGHS